MPSKTTLVIYARSVAESYSGMQDKWDYLKDMYDKAMMVPPNWTVQDGANVKALKESKWLRKNGVPGGTNVAAEGISWCGIWATYCLQAIGVHVKWVLNQGISPLKPNLQLCTYFDSDKIEPGDICVKDKNQHHFIVYHRSGDTLYSYDGNLPGQMIGKNEHSISKAKEAAKKSDTEVAEKRKQMSEAEFKKWVSTNSKYSFHFYRLIL